MAHDSHDCSQQRSKGRMQGNRKGNRWPMIATTVLSRGVREGCRGIGREIDGP